MGCDIHLYTESFNGQRWVADYAQTFDNESEADDTSRATIREGYAGCNYALFGLLNAGVRCEFPFSFPSSQKLPSDASPEVLDLFVEWGSDAHSPGTQTFAQLKLKAAELLLLTDTEIRSAQMGLADLLKQITSVKPAVPGVCDEHRRILYWFDN